MHTRQTVVRPSATYALRDPLPPAFALAVHSHHADMLGAKGPHGDR